MIQYDRRV